MDVYLQLGAGFAVLIIMMREVFSFAKWIMTRGKIDPAVEVHTKTLQALEKVIVTIDKLNNKLDTPIREIDDLHRWHDKTDEDGVRVWYIRKSVIDRFMEEIEKQNISLDIIINMLRDTK